MSHVSHESFVVLQIVRVGVLVNPYAMDSPRLKRENPRVFGKN